MVLQHDDKDYLLSALISESPTVVYVNQIRDSKDLCNFYKTTLVPIAPDTFT